MYKRSGFLAMSIRHLVIWFLIAFAVLPIVWIGMASLNPSNSLITGGLVPRRLSFVHYIEMFSNPRHPFGLWIWNSVKIAGISSFLIVLMSALGAYAFSRFRFKGRRAGLLTLILIQMFPQMLALVALYLLLLSLGEFIPWLGLNTHTGLILVYLGGALGFNTWLMKGYFDTIPKELVESAMIDGATPFQAYWRIILPLVKPILAVVFILSFIGIYSEFILASIILSDSEKYTLAVGLRLFVFGQYSTRWGVFSAASIVGSVPFMIIFLLLQRFLVSGLTRGATKG